MTAELRRVAVRPPSTRGDYAAALWAQPIDLDLLAEQHAAFVKLLRRLGCEVDVLHPVDDIGGGPVLFFPLDRRLITAPFLRLPEAPRSFFLGLLRRADPPTAARIAVQLADNEAIYGRVLDVGGVRYLPDTLPEDRLFWPAHFGEDWRALKAAKARLDPAGVLIGSFGASLRGVPYGGS